MRSKQWATLYGKALAQGYDEAAAEKIADALDGVPQADDASVAPDGVRRADQWDR